MADIVNITDDNFKSEVTDSKGQAVLVDFWADWCGPCKMIAPVLEEISQDYDDNLKICKLNVDENSQTAGNFGVMSIPTLILFKDGDEKERIVGYQSKEELKKVIDKYV